MDWREADLIEAEEMEGPHGARAIWAVVVWPLVAAVAWGIVWVVFR